MHLSTRLDHDLHGLLVRVTGELDRATAPALDAVLMTAQDVLTRSDGPVGDRHALRVDMNGVRSVDRAGLAPLEGARVRLEAAGARLRMQAVPPHLERLLVLLADPLLPSVATTTAGRSDAVPVRARRRVTGEAPGPGSPGRGGPADARPAQRHER